MNLDEGSDGRTGVFISSADEPSIEGSIIKLRKFVKKKMVFFRYYALVVGRTGAKGGERLTIKNTD